MAVVITQTFDDIEGLQQPFIATLSNGDIAQNKFRYILQVNNGTSNIVKIKQQKNSGDVAHFDIQRIIQSLTSSTYNNSYDSGHIHDIYKCSDNDGNIVYVQLRGGQEWALSGTTSAPTEYLNQTSKSCYVFDSNFQFGDGLQPDVTPFQLTSSTSSAIRFLTNAPLIQSIRTNEFGTLAFLNVDPDGQTPDLQYEVTYYDSDGEQIQRYTKDLVTDLLAPNPVTSFVVANIADALIYIPCGYANLELLADTSARPSAQTSAVASYKIRIYNSGDGAETWETFTFKVICENKYEPKRLVWKNRLGTWDYFTFLKRNDESVNIQRKQFRKPVGTWNAATFTIPTYDSGLMNYDVLGDRVVTCHSDYVNDETAAWLEELFTSKEVFVWDGTNYLAIVVNEQGYQKKLGVNDGWKNYTISYTLANQVR